LPVVGCGRSAPPPEPSTVEPRVDAPAPKPIVPAATAGPVDRYDQHITALRKKLGKQEFVILKEEPFVVIGEGERERVERYATGIVRWAVDRLKAAYFDADPDHIIDIWLFEGSESYERNALALFGERPDTPYGYYSGKDRALVMNIATGGGTLVHEIVHPFMGANFPQCPSWFNEGLASLYEQSAERNDEIVGLTNWRLAGLQESLREGAVPTFKRLCSSGEGFYTADPGTNYAQARYLCYWLQEKGKLREYYKAFRGAAAADKTGYETLRLTVGEDMPAFRKDWESFVLGLRYTA
jgi:hypothetical protein